MGEADDGDGDEGRGDCDEDSRYDGDGHNRSDDDAEDESARDDDGDGDDEDHHDDDSCDDHNDADDDDDAGDEDDVDDDDDTDGEDDGELKTILMMTMPMMMMMLMMMMMMMMVVVVVLMMMMMMMMMMMAGHFMKPAMLSGCRIEKFGCASVAIPEPTWHAGIHLPFTCDAQKPCILTGLYFGSQSLYFRTGFCGLRSIKGSPSHWLLLRTDTQVRPFQHENAFAQASSLETKVLKSKNPQP